MAFKCDWILGKFKEANDKLLNLDSKTRVNDDRSNYGCKWGNAEANISDRNFDKYSVFEGEDGNTAGS